MRHQLRARPHEWIHPNSGAGGWEASAEDNAINDSAIALRRGQAQRRRAAI
jgi:hypothetical protein